MTFLSAFGGPTQVLEVFAEIELAVIWRNLPGTDILKPSRGFLQIKIEGCQ